MTKKKEYKTKYVLIPKEVIGSEKGHQWWKVALKLELHIMIKRHNTDYFMTAKELKKRFWPSDRLQI